MSVELAVAAPQDAVIVTVLGLGSLIGDVNFLNSGNRSVTYVVATDSAVAVLN